MKEKIINKLAKLIDLKSILTFMVGLAMIIFTANGTIGGEMFVTLGTLTFKYYFDRKNDEVNENVKNSKETDSSK